MKGREKKKKVILVSHVVDTLRTYENSSMEASVNGEKMLDNEEKK